MTIDLELRPSDSLPPGVASLRFDATVPRGLVHRAAVAETLLTDAAEVGEDRYVVAAQLPRGHVLYNDGRGRYHDLLLLAEVVRQAGTLVSHRFYDVPEGFIFPLRRAQIEVTDLDAMATSDVASQMVADIRIAGQERQSGTLASMALEAALIVDGLRVGSAGGAIHFVSPSSYRTLRRNRPAADDDPAHVSVRRAEPHRVGRCDLRNVVVGELERPTGHEGYTCRIVADTRHPSFFDHPQDHIPGMLLLEAYRQLALLAVADACAWAPESLLVVACDATFSRYAELDLEARCSASVGEPVLPRRGEAWVPVSLKVSQQGATLSEATVRIADVNG
jgi:2-oxo-3-(phosphooxy)propyl 3-oxoalkanoate synthase